MKKFAVAHFLRKSSQLKSTFIQNQVTNHINYKPYIIFRLNKDKNCDSAFSDFDLNKYKYLDLSQSEIIYEKIFSKTTRTLSKKRLNLILQFIKNNQINICHFHYGTDCGIFFPLLKKINIPSVVSFYGYDAYSFPNKFGGIGKYYLKERVFNYATKILAMTPEMKNDLIKYGFSKEKILIHYHGVPSFLSSLKMQYENKKNINLLMLSYLDPVKGHIFVFKALKRLIQQGNKNLQLTIVGRGHYEEVLKSFVLENGLDNYVEFIGSVKYHSSSFLKYFSRADIFLHPSVLTKDDKEGIPGSIVEAMFAGLPVIATYHGGIPYILRNEITGILIEEWDVKALANAILNLSNSSDLRKNIGIAAQNYAINNLDLKLKEKELEDIYNSLIE